MKKTCATLLVALPAAVTFTSCESIYDDELEPCPQGLQVRFIYDYTLEGGNAFMEQVDCLTLYVYDSNGNYVRTVTETSSVLADENYRMTLDLPAGDYHLMAYGGIECDEASFLHDDAPAEGQHFSDVTLKLHPDCLEEGNDKAKLHDLFYGAIDVTVDNPTDYTPCTVKMMKDTNHFRIMLQNLNYEPLDGNDYDFIISDDNTLFNHANDLIDNGIVEYTAWDKGSVGTGIVDYETRTVTEVKLAYAELSTSRLMTKRSPTLIVKAKDNGEEIIRLPLNNYLWAMASERYKDKYGKQEFLDRESNWNMTFFMMDGHTWAKTHIVVNDWEVRVNMADF